MNVRVVGMARRLLAGSAVGFVVVVIWVLTEGVVSIIPAEAPAPHIDATRDYPVSPPPIGGPNDNRAQSEKESEASKSEIAVVSQLEERPRSTPCEIMMSRAGSQSASLVLYHRHKILSSEDDPEWARPMERELFAYVMQVSASDSTIVESITCRSAGCEMQLSHGPESQAATRVLLGLRERFPSLPFALDKPGLVGDRILQLTYLTRLNQETE